MPIEISASDERILTILQCDGRISNNQLAERASISESSALRRTRALEQVGVIMGYQAKIDPKQIGYQICAYVLVNLDQRSETDTAAFFESVEHEHRIVECTALTGTSDLLLRVVARDIEDLGDLTMKGILRHPSVKDIASSVVIKVIKPFAGYQVTTG